MQVEICRLRTETLFADAPKKRGAFSGIFQNADQHGQIGAGEKVDDLIADRSVLRDDDRKQFSVIFKRVDCLLHGVIPPKIR